MSLPPSLRPFRSNFRSRLVSRFGRPARAVAFWGAITLPAVYLPLFAVEARWLPSWIVFGLLGLNIVALLVGHSYEQ